VSPEDLDLIRGLYEAMSKRDVAALRAFSDANPDFEWQPSPYELDPSVKRGGRKTLAYSQELFESFDQLETEVREVIALGPEAAIFRVHHRVRGAASGVEVERDEAHLWMKKDGRIASLREFATVEEARECALRS
jgi:ketosteroid isomerase-like protein